MEGLANYGSDDDYDESPHHEEPAKCQYESNTQREMRIVSKEQFTPKEKDADNDNYEDIAMDLSEPDGKRCLSSSKGQEVDSPSHTPPRILKPKPMEDKSKHELEGRKTRSRKSSRERRHRSRTRSASRSRSRSRSRSPKSRRREEKYRETYRKDKEEVGHVKRKDRDSSRRRSRSRNRDHKVYKESRKDLPGSNRESRATRESYRESRKVREYVKEPRDNNCRDRYAKRFDRATNKLAHLEKMGIDVNKSQDRKQDVGFCSVNSSAAMTSLQNKVDESRILPPGVTGRLREQMERRKALWQKKDPEAESTAQCTVVPNSGKVWEATTFAHDQEGKQANKFKRLMGIREGPAAGNEKADSLAKKQEELFSSMEQQYEVARTATHTMRGVGLGFGSFQR